jgi:hypothetical protein
MYALEQWQYCTTDMYCSNIVLPHVCFGVVTVLYHSYVQQYCSTTCMLSSSDSIVSQLCTAILFYHMYALQQWQYCITVMCSNIVLPHVCSGEVTVLYHSYVQQQYCSTTCMHCVRMRPSSAKPCLIVLRSCQPILLLLAKPDTGFPYHLLLSSIPPPVYLLL